MFAVLQDAKLFQGPEHTLKNSKSSLSNNSHWEDDTCSSHSCSICNVLSCLLCILSFTSLIYGNTIKDPTSYNSARWTLKNLNVVESYLRTLSHRFHAAKETLQTPHLQKKTLNLQYLTACDVFQSTSLVKRRHIQIDLLWTLPPWQN